mgnify:CR=1 FL=1
MQYATPPITTTAQVISIMIRIGRGILLFMPINNIVQRSRIFMYSPYFCKAARSSRTKAAAIQPIKKPSVKVLFEKNIGTTSQLPTSTPSAKTKSSLLIINSPSSSVWISSRPRIIACGNNFVNIFEQNMSFRLYWRYFDTRLKIPIYFTDLRNGFLLCPPSPSNKKSSKESPS